MRLAPRHRIALRELLRRPGRSALTVLAMTAGLVQIGIMLHAYALLRPELTGMYARTRPASATVALDSLDAAELELVRQRPGVADAELRHTLVARVRTAAGDWIPAPVQVVHDFDQQRLDRFTRDRGAWPPAAGEVLLERTALPVARVDVGDSLTFRLADGRECRLRVAGTVHAPGLAPAWMEHMVPVYVGPGSWLRGEGSEESAQLKLLAAHPLDEGAIREAADSVTAALERRGHRLGRVLVPPPGRHPHAAQMEAFLFLLLTFGLLSFALAAVLVASLVHAMFRERLREIGILQTLGATSRDLVAMHQLQVALLAAAALLVAGPLGAWAGRTYATFSAGILNTDVSRSPFPWWALAVQLAAGLAVPALVALVPLRRAARVSVREALQGEAAQMPPASGSPRFSRLPRTWALTFRALLLRPADLAVTVSLLAVGGAVFVAAVSVAEDWQRSVEADFARRHYDLQVGFSDPLPVATADRLLRALPGVTGVEYWPGTGGWLVSRAGVPSQPLTLLGPAATSLMYRPQLSAGRWLDASDPEGVVVNQAIASQLPGLAPGDRVQLRTHGRTWSFRVRGIAREIAPMPLVYGVQERVREVAEADAAFTSSARLVLDRHDDAAQRATADALERTLANAGIGVRNLQRTADAKQGILDHLVIIFSVLVVSALVVVFVGGLGLATSLTLGVVQRTRELGMLSAVGARPAVLAGLVALEGVGMALMAWAVGALLAAPAAWAMERACGSIFLRLPLPFWWSPRGALAWLAGSLFLALIAAIAPAQRAARLTVRDALSHT